MNHRKGEHACLSRSRLCPSWRRDVRDTEWVFVTEITKQVQERLQSLFYFIFVVTYPSPNTRRQTCVTQASLVIRKLMDRCVYNCLAGQVLHYVTDHWKANAWEVDGLVRIIRHLCHKFVSQYLARKRQRRSDRKTESVWQSEDVNNLLNFNHPFIKGGIDEEIDN